MARALRFRPTRRPSLPKQKLPRAPSSATQAKIAPLNVWGDADRLPAKLPNTPSTTGGSSKRGRQRGPLVKEGSSRAAPVSTSPLLTVPLATPIRSRTQRGSRSRPLSGTAESRRDHDARMFRRRRHALERKNTVKPKCSQTRCAAFLACQLFQAPRKQTRRQVRNRTTK